MRVFLLRTASVQWGARQEMFSDQSQEEFTEDRLDTFENGGLNHITRRLFTFRCLWWLAAASVQQGLL